MMQEPVARSHRQNRDGPRSCATSWRAAVVPISLDSPATLRHQRRARWRRVLRRNDQLSERNGLSAVMNPLQRRRLGRLRLVYGLDAIENLAEIAFRDLNVIVVLQIEPKLCRCAERLGEPKRSIGGNAGLFAGDPPARWGRKAAGLGKSARRHFQRNQELLPQNLTGMHGLELLGHCRVLSSSGSPQSRPPLGLPASKQS